MILVALKITSMHARQFEIRAKHVIIISIHALKANTKITLMSCRGLWAASL